jgi:predicted secreted protein
MKILKFILTIISISIILSQNIKSIFIPVDISNLDIKIKENTEFELKIKGNPTTGYNWYILNYDELPNLDIICLNKDNTGEFIYDPNQVGIVGIGGTFTFRFKVNSHNNNFKTIKLIYKRDWENNPNDFIVSINVLVIE